MVSDFSHGFCGFCCAAVASQASHSFKRQLRFENFSALLSISRFTIRHIT
jgi:hypothetical protein